ncbi:MAG: response regulator [Crocinitomicaceae bacterium]|nr:response regulator [Crocinitomicaceae bacterium]
MERFINILVIHPEEIIQIGLKEILSGGGNNVLMAGSNEDALTIIGKKEVGIIILDINALKIDKNVIQELKSKSLLKNNYIVLIANRYSTDSKLVKGMQLGAVDYIPFPFNPNLIKSKIEVFKTLYYKDQRIGQLLSNIFPETVLNELSLGGKFSPKRVENGIVLFTDFVDFSMKAKASKPLFLIQQLEKYFSKFDEIMLKYNLEKIKTIGDAYMALSGVTEDEPEPAIRACLAAIEIRDFMRNERDVAIALKRDFWEIRIGLHMGPLVAGIVGSTKYSFDVWGDTVNVASRAESGTKNGSISITKSIHDKIENYFNTIPRGKVDLKKRGGSIEMFYLENIKEENSMFNEGFLPNSDLRIKCGLWSMDFEQMRSWILNHMKSLLPEIMQYHDIPHTLNVEKAAIRYAKLEGVNGEELLLIRTAALFHDSGFILQYDNNEDFAKALARATLPNFGYKENQIEIICNCIEVTKPGLTPVTLLEQIMVDADYDYLGRPDYHVIVKKLRGEMEDFGTTMSDIDWIEYQLNFLENHHQYYTITAQNIRNYGKSVRINDLKKKLATLIQN